MKKLTTVLVILLFCLSGFAKDLGGNFYMMSTGEKLDCKKIQVGSSTIKATLMNGEKVSIPCAMVKMYSLNGKIYENLPVYVKNKYTEKHKFMEFVTTRAGLRLYKYSTIEENVNTESGTYLSVSNNDHYLVFKGDQFYVEVTEKNYQTLFDFFRVTYPSF